jgi:hypothetical protein
MSPYRYPVTEHWEPWQTEYRYGAFYVFPPPGIIDGVDALRAEHDPRSHAYCQAHISLSAPLQAPLTAEQIAEVRANLATCAPFVLHYGPLRSFLPYPGVVYTIEPQERYFHLRSLVHSSSVFAGPLMAHRDIVPHMTIAEFITAARTVALLEELAGQVPEGDFLCDAVEYAIPNNQFYFERVLTIPLGEHR